MYCCHDLRIIQANWIAQIREVQSCDMVPSGEREVSEAAILGQSRVYGNCIW